KLSQGSSSESVDEEEVEDPLSEVQLPVKSTDKSDTSAKNNFLREPSETMTVGRLKESANVRGGDTSAIKSQKGAVVIYDESIHKSFSQGRGAVRHHVWGAVISGADGKVLPRDQWKIGWIATFKLKPEPDHIDKVRGKAKDAIETTFLKGS